MRARRETHPRLRRVPPRRRPFRAPSTPRPRQPPPGTSLASPPPRRRNLAGRERGAVSGRPRGRSRRTRSRTRASNDPATRRASPATCLRHPPPRASPSAEAATPLARASPPPPSTRTTTTRRPFSSRTTTTFAPTPPTAPRTRPTPRAPCVASSAPCAVARPSNTHSGTKTTPVRTHARDDSRRTSPPPPSERFDATRGVDPSRRVRHPTRHQSLAATAAVALIGSRRSSAASRAAPMTPKPRERASPRSSDASTKANAAANPTRTPTRKGKVPSLIQGKVPSLLQRCRVSTSRLGATSHARGRPRRRRRRVGSTRDATSSSRARSSRASPQGWSSPSETPRQK